MKAMHIQLLIIALVVSEKIKAQPNYWDVGHTEAVIAHNKKNYDDHKEARDNQLVSTVTVTAWKKAKDQCKVLVDKIDNRLTQAFVVVADITSLYNTYNTLKDVLAYQDESFQLLFKYPYAAILFYDHEVELVKSAQELYGFIMLIILTYGDISKMEVNARATVFRAMGDQLYVLRARAINLLQKLKQIDFANLYKNTKGWGYINRDAEIVNNILKNF